MAKRRRSRSLEEEDLNPKRPTTRLSSRRQAPEPIIQEEPLFDPANYTSLLQILNQTSKMLQLVLSAPVEAPKAIIQTSPLFTPGSGDGLIKVINQLDPVSFHRFSRTCKSIHNVCYNTKEIEVQFGCRDVKMVYFQGDETLIWLTVERSGYRNPKVEGEDLENLLKSPFAFTISEIQFAIGGKVNARILKEVTSFLRRFHRVRIGYINTEQIGNWNAFAQFIKEFGAKSIYIDSVRLPRKTLPIFMNKVDTFGCDGQVPHDLILSATSKRLYLREAAITPETFKELLKRFRAGLVHYWYLGREACPAEEDQFLVDACREVMEVVRVQEIEEPDMKPDVLYVVVPNASRRLFSLLKSDGSVGKFVVCHSIVHFDNDMCFCRR